MCANYWYKSQNIETYFLLTMTVVDTKDLEDSNELRSGKSKHLLYLNSHENIFSLGFLPPRNSFSHLGFSGKCNKKCNCYFDLYFNFNLHYSFDFLTKRLYDTTIILLN